MIINYNVSGSDRKRLVAAIAQHTGEKAKYLGAPGFAYQVGDEDDKYYPGTDGKGNDCRPLRGIGRGYALCR